MPLIDHARAKINLTLVIRGKRADGFHELDSLVAFADAAADVLTLDTTRDPDLTITGLFARDLTDGGNLVATAIVAVAEAFPRIRLGHVTLEKNLPVAAGIGGGSADAAAILRLLRRANPLAQTDDATWARLAAELGSDVPVCVESRLSIMRGRGDVVVPLSPRSLPAAVLVNPRITVPADKTAAVFKVLAAPPLSAPIDDPRSGLPGADATHINALAAAGNDLEPAALRVMPAAKAVLAELRALAGVRAVRLSGAGPTAFALFDTMDAATQAARAIGALQPTWWTVATTLR